jgi:hypothetical protein
MDALNMIDNHSGAEAQQVPPIYATDSISQLIEGQLWRQDEGLISV